MVKPIAYFICRCQTYRPIQSNLFSHSLLSSFNTLIFDNCSAAALHYVEQMLNNCSYNTSLCFLHEAPQMNEEETSALHSLRYRAVSFNPVFCKDYGKTSYMRQRRHRRYLEQADFLIVASDIPSAEVSNAVRFARLKSIPVIDLTSGGLHFRP